MKPIINPIVIFYLTILFNYQLSYAQTPVPSPPVQESFCPMCESLGWGIMVLWGLSAIAIVAAMIVLVGILVRRGPDRDKHRPL